jgi:hypothetical protein
MSTPTVEKLTNGDTRIVITDKYGNEFGKTLTPVETAALAYKLLVDGLPDSHVTHYLLGKQQ